jgi:type I restriction enzyme, S subunit
MARPLQQEGNGALEDRNNLPEGWIRIVLQEAVSRIADGSHNPPKKEAIGIPMLSARNIENGQIKFDDNR